MLGAPAAAHGPQGFKMSNTAKSSPKRRPFGAKGGSKDRFTAAAAAKKGKSLVVITPALRKKFGSRLTAGDQEFIRRAESATGGCTLVVGRPRRF